MVDPRSLASLSCLDISCLDSSYCARSITVSAAAGPVVPGEWLTCFAAELRPRLGPHDRYGMLAFKTSGVAQAKLQRRLRQKTKSQGALDARIGREVSVPTGLSPHEGKYAFAVMVKAPRSGEVKTRLVPPLCAQEASRLSACFVKDILANLLSVAESVPIDCYAAYSPPGSEALFHEFLPPQVRLLAPRSIGLANSLPDAVEDLIAGGYAGACGDASGRSGSTPHRSQGRERRDRPERAGS